MKNAGSATWNTMRLLPIAVLLAASPAVAQPAPAGVGSTPVGPADAPAPAGADPEDGPCQVTFTLRRVPSEVQAIIDTWVRTEPTCATSLDVSIEAVERGYIVRARDVQGDIRVRIVPDAETIGVLIASWSADDRFATAPRVPAAVVAEVPAQVGAPATVAAVATSAPIVIAGDPPHGRRFMFHGVAGPENGARAQLDLFGRRVPFGVALGTQRDQWGTFNLQATLYSGLEFAHDGWHLRMQLGAGIKLNDVQLGAGTDTDAADPSLGIRGRGYDIATELNLTATHQLTGRWAMTAGFALNTTLQTYSAGTRIEPQAPLPLAVLGISRFL